MGRHQAEPKPRPVQGHANEHGHRHELLGWGIFVTVVAAAAMSYYGLRSPIVFLVAAVALAAFVLSWVCTQLHAERDAEARRASGRRSAAHQASARRAAATAHDASARSAPAPATATPSTPMLLDAPAADLEHPAALVASSYPTVSAASSLPSAAVVPTTPPAAKAAAPAEQAPVIRPTSPALNRLRNQRPVPTVQAAHAYEASPHASSWTKTFGAPDTGPIPIQPYVARGRRAATVGAGAERGTAKRQMSHSRL